MVRREVCVNRITSIWPNIRWTLTCVATVLGSNRHISISIDDKIVYTVSEATVMSESRFSDSSVCPAAPAMGCAHSEKKCFRGKNWLRPRPQGRHSFDPSSQPISIVLLAALRGGKRRQFPQHSLSYCVRITIVQNRYYNPLLKNLRRYKVKHDVCNHCFSE